MIRPPASAGSSAEIAVWQRRPPVLSTTRYDRVSSTMIALLIAMCVLAGWALALWLSNVRTIVPISTGELKHQGLAGDSEIEDKPLKVESPAEPRKDPSVVDKDNSEPSAELTINRILTVSADAAQRFSEVKSSDVKDGGIQGRQDGSGRPALGEGSIDGRRAPHLRWFIRFSDRGSLETYAAQLDHFGIELGYYKQRSKQIKVLSHLSRKQAVVTTIHSGNEKPNVMVFFWSGGGRKRADVQLFNTKAGIDAKIGIIMHFYPQKTVRLLADAERNAAKRPVSEILRTYFSVISSGNGFRFVASKINYRNE